MEETSQMSNLLKRIKSRQPPSQMGVEASPEDAKWSVLPYTIRVYVITITAYYIIIISLVEIVVFNQISF